MDDFESAQAAIEHNRRAWNELVRKKQRFTIPARDEDFQNPLAAVDQLGWLGGSIRGKRVLCLAAGGGRQAPLYAAAGATVTVVDLSSAMLELDREVARERGLELTTVETSMDRLTMFEAGWFDVVIHPVSTCYVPTIQPVFEAVARVTRAGGLYVSQHKSPTSLQCDLEPSAHGYELREPYYRSGPLPAVVGSKHREEGTLEYLHRLEEILGGLCRAGFAIEDVVEPLHADLHAEVGTFGHRSRFVAPYLRLKARRIAGSPTVSGGLWTP
jgi:ubiquinone/menaquinone biosynthesis C-methylase UbiE